MNRIPAPKAAANAGAKISGLHRLSLGVAQAQIAGVGAFYRDVWGMRLVSQDDNRVLLQSRASGYTDLCIEASEQSSGIRSLGLCVAHEQDLAPLLSAAEKLGGRVLRAPSASADFHGEFGASLSDPDGNRIELAVHDAPAPKVPACVAGLGRHVIGPLRIGHVVLWTPQIAAMEAFYAQLGLRVSDRTAMGMSFLRCNSDHHSLALAKHVSKTGLQHVAFDVQSIDAVMYEKGRLNAAGFECLWGPGRHGPGHNVFTYYHDPAGNVIEFYGDMEQLSGSDLPPEPVYWGPEHRGDIWGIAGPAPLVFRE